MSEFKTKRLLKFYKKSSLDSIIGEVTYMRNKPEVYPYKILIFDEPYFEVDSYRHILRLMVINNKKRVKYKDKDYVREDSANDLSQEVSKDLYGLLKDLVDKYNHVGSKQYSISLTQGAIIVDLR